MPEVLFYHLERASLESVLPGLLEKTLERGWKAVVRARARERVDAIDALLWIYREDSFLPHGSGSEFAARQPVFITDGPEKPNGAEVLFLVDGASADQDELSSFVRCVTIFDGGDEAAVGAARAFWKRAKDAGCEATYWKQADSGRWEKQA